MPLEATPVPTEENQILKFGSNNLVKLEMLSFCIVLKLCEKHTVQVLTAVSNPPPPSPSHTFNEKYTNTYS